MNICTRIASLALALSLAFPALAEPGTHEGAPRGHGHDAGGDLLGPLHHAIRELDLSEEQRAAIRELFEASHEDLAANRAATESSRAALHELLSAETLDQEALATLAREQGDLTEERIVITANIAAGVLAELSSEQRTELAAMRAEMELPRGPRPGGRRAETTGS